MGFGLPHPVRDKAVLVFVRIVNPGLVARGAIISLACFLPSSFFSFILWQHHPLKQRLVVVGSCVTEFHSLFSWMFCSKPDFYKSSPQFFQFHSLFSWMFHSKAYILKGIRELLQISKSLQHQQGIYVRSGMLNKKNPGSSQYLGGTLRTPETRPDV